MLHSKRSLGKSLGAGVPLKGVNVPRLEQQAKALKEEIKRYQAKQRAGTLSRAEKTRFERAVHDLQRIQRLIDK